MMGKISIALTVAFILFASLPLVSSAAPPEYDIIIRNGRVIDGSRRPAYGTDLASKDDRLVRAGNCGAAGARHVIDARGQVVAPGFLDMRGQSEQCVLIDPRAMSKVMM